MPEMCDLVMSSLGKLVTCENNKLMLRVRKVWDITLFP